MSRAADLRGKGDGGAEDRRGPEEEKEGRGRKGGTADRFVEGVQRKVADEHLVLQLALNKIGRGEKGRKKEICAVRHTKEE